MWRTFPLLYCFYVLLSSGTSTGDDRRWLVSIVDLVEMDYEDHCDERATASWEEFLGNEMGLSLKLERDKAFGIFASKQKMDVKSAFITKALSADDDVLRRRVKLLLQPGDTLLETEQWIRGLY